MALTAEGDQLTSAHLRQQLALRASTLLDLATLWHLFDPAQPGSYGAFVTAATALIRDRHGDSSSLAAAYLSVFREAEGIPGRIPEFRRAERPLPEQIVVALRATGLAGTVRALRAGQTTRQALASGLVQVSGATSRLVLAGGRQTVEAFVEADAAARGWIRVTSVSPCAFCAMLASRGPAYRSERTARFQSHDHCACAASPWYGGREPAANVRFRQTWQLAQGEARAAGELDRGTSNDALNAFRRHLENSGE